MIKYKCISSYLNSEINVGAGKDLPRIYRVGEILVCCDLILDANRRLRNLYVFLVIMIVQGSISGHCHVGLRIVALWRNTAPEDNTVWIGISRRYAVGEVQRRWVADRLGIVPLDNLVD